MYECNLHYIYKMCYMYILIGVIMMLLVEQCRLTQSSNNQKLHPYVCSGGKPGQCRVRY